MRKLFLILVGMVCVGLAGAEMIDYITVTQTTGAEAQYNAATGDLSWSGGFSGSLLTSDYKYVEFDAADVDFDFDRITPASGSSASFNVVTPWTVVLSQGVVTLTLQGTAQGTYYETEANPDVLEGGVVLECTSVVLGGGTLLDYLGAALGNLAWYGGDNVVGCESDISLASGANWPGYSADYDTGADGGNLTLTIWADEGQVPEPTSLGLLALGGLLLRRRK